MKKLISLILLASSLNVSAADLRYCTGNVIDLVTRATTEGTSFRVEGMGGWINLSYGGAEQAEMHQRQLSMLLAAQMSASPVTVEFLGDHADCASNVNDVEARFIRIQK